MNGGAVERVGSLLHQAARDPVGLGLGLGLQLRLLLLSLPRRVLMVCLDRRFEDILEGYATACVSAIDFIVDFLFFFLVKFRSPIERNRSRFPKGLFSWVFYLFEEVVKNFE